MPSSYPQLISPIIEIIRSTQPQSVLDIGIGFGKFGFLCREYLELWDGRNKYGDWKKRIDGIEAFPQYVTPLQKQIYDNIFIGDARQIVPTLTHYYDLILMIDVIEHFTLEEGHRLLHHCAKHSRGLLISTPLAVSAQEDSFGNPFEIHKSQWTPDQFNAFPEKVFFPNPHALLCYLRFDGVKVQATPATAPAGA
jgi:SAM-dependent methyltransferase